MFSRTTKLVLKGLIGPKWVSHGLCFRSTKTKVVNKPFYTKNSKRTRDQRKRKTLT